MIARPALMPPRLIADEAEESHSDQGAQIGGCPRRHIQRRVDLDEIEAADWFSGEALPVLPDRVSIARRLIDAALAGE